MEEVKKPKAKAPPALPWMRHPLDINRFQELQLQQVPFLDSRLQEAVAKMGISSLFPVQMAVWHEMMGPGAGERDLSVCSPTGSGKTLAYALPIAQALSGRVLRRLRALVVVPTRDLAMQVKAVFDAIAPSIGLSVGLAVGQSSVTAEAAQLVHFPGELDSCFRELCNGKRNMAESLVDILVATPGRLMDHVWNTTGFTLADLQYLVVDEIDRLLREAYQEWLPNVLEAAGANRESSTSGASSGPIRTIRRFAVERGMSGCAIPRVKKIILSATLTRDPAKIAQLGLYHPLSIALSTDDHLYVLPPQLHSYKLICKPNNKPLKLVSLLHSLGEQRTVIFTASVSSTHRVYLFLSAFEGLPFKVVEYSSLQHQLDRSKALASFRSGKAQVLVASDAMARGMDVEGVTHIINYDTPSYAKTYIHRVGRTARAGRSGCSFTLLRKQEVRHFKSLLAKVQNGTCKTYKVPPEVVNELYPRYTAALERLQHIVTVGSGKAVPDFQPSQVEQTEET